MLILIPRFWLGIVSVGVGALGPSDALVAGFVLSEQAWPW